MSPSFADHVAAIGQFLDRRRPIVECIDRTLLNVQHKPLARSRDRRQFDALLQSCCVEASGRPAERAQTAGALAARHHASGFTPVRLEGFAHEFDPLELIVRMYEYWTAHRWPGYSGRMACAEQIFAAFIVKQLEYLSLRVWDDDLEHAAARLDEVQVLLDRANAAERPTVFVRDAAWLTQTAQGPLTRDLEPYFTVARHVRATGDARRRLAMHAAGAALAGGHLRSQLRYRVWNSGRPIDDPELVAFNRNSNAMDTALLVYDLAPLLLAYNAARAHGDDTQRLRLADAILQGLSADPELLVTRLDLLGPYTTIDHLSVNRSGNGALEYTSHGHDHLTRLREYSDQLAAAAPALQQDASAFEPAAENYSPFGIVYGFIADVFSNIANAALLGLPSFGLSLEDMFISHGHLDQKLEIARAWALLPQRPGERAHFEHSNEWATSMFIRLREALELRAARPGEPNASAVPSRAIVTGADDARATAREYCFTSDPERALTGAATLQSVDQMLDDRGEGRFLASAECDDGWFGVSKLVLSVFLCQGIDAAIGDVPSQVLDVLRLTCPGLLMTNQPPDGTTVPPPSDVG